MMMIMTAQLTTGAVDWATFNNDVDDENDVDNLYDDVDDE